VEAQRAVARMSSGHFVPGRHAGPDIAAAPLIVATVACAFDHIRHTSIRCVTINLNGTTGKRNERLHGVTFELARLVFHDPNAIDRLDLDEADEERELITGLVGDVLFTVCYVERGHRKRIISARKATNREQIDYNEANAPPPNGN